MKVIDRFKNRNLYTYGTSEVLDCLVKLGFSVNRRILLGKQISVQKYIPLSVCWSTDGYHDREGYEYMPADEFLRKVKSEMFSKADLKSGMVVELSSGHKYLVVGTLLIGRFTQSSLDNYDDFLKSKKAYPLDIVRVYNAHQLWSCGFSSGLNNGCLAWQRKDNYEQLKKIEELKATIAEASKQIKELEEEL